MLGFFIPKVKTLSPCEKYSVNGPSGDKAFGFVASTREVLVNKQYIDHARKLDHLRHGTVPGEIGPMEDRLNQFGRGGEVIGLVIGAYGECSAGVHDLADLIATKRAHDYCGSHSISLARAKNMFRQSLYRKWGLFAHRGWAHLLLQRSERVGCSAHQGDGDGVDASEAQLV